MSQSDWRWTQGAVTLAATSLLACSGDSLMAPAVTHPSQPAAALAAVGDGGHETPDPRIPPVCHGHVATIWWNMPTEFMPQGAIVRAVVPGPDDHDGHDAASDSSDAHGDDAPGYVIIGTAAADVIVGSPKRDSIMGANGDDVICADPPQHDEADSTHDEAGSTHDGASGSAHDGASQGGGGPDHVWGGNGHDVLYGGGGPDTLDGGNGDDTLVGGGGPDYLIGGNGNDLLDGGPGPDTLLGGRGNDVLRGGAAKDELDGGPGDNQLDPGDDTGHDTGDGTGHEASTGDPPPLKLID